MMLAWPFLIALAGVGAFTILGLGILKTINRHMDRRADLERARLPGGASEETRAELEDVRFRLGEIEERLDFTERLLAKEHPQERLKSS